MIQYNPLWYESYHNGLNFYVYFLGIQYVRVGHQHSDQLPITETIDSDDNTICQAPQSYYEFTANHHGDGGVTQGMACDYVFDKGICCGGYFGQMGFGGGQLRYLVNPSCGHLDSSGWTSLPSMPKALTQHASLVYNDKWLISGGYGTISNNQPIIELFQQSFR